MTGQEVEGEALARAGRVAQGALDILGDDVDLDVDVGAGPPAGQRDGLLGVVDERDAELVGGDIDDGEAGAVEGDEALGTT